MPRSPLPFSSSSLNELEKSFKNAWWTGLTEGSLFEEMTEYRGFILSGGTCPSAHGALPPCSDPSWMLSIEKEC